MTWGFTFFGFLTFFLATSLTEGLAFATTFLLLTEAFATFEATFFEDALIDFFFFVGILKIDA